MSDDLITPDAREVVRDLIRTMPELVLDDPDIVQTLLAAGSQGDGRVIDLRSVLVERIKGQLGELESTHRSVIAAAYENIAGTRAIHRAVLALLETSSFADFLKALETEIASILAVDRVRIGLELDHPAEAYQDVPALVALPRGGIADYIGTVADRPLAQVTLRGVTGQAHTVFGDDTYLIRSEAVITLDLGPDRRAAMLVFGSDEVERFTPDQGTELLIFFAGVFERQLRRWIE